MKNLPPRLTAIPAFVAIILIAGITIVFKSPMLIIKGEVLATIRKVIIIAALSASDLKRGLVENIRTNYLFTYLDLEEKKKTKPNGSNDV